MLSMSYRLTIGVLSFLVQVVNVFRIKSYEDIYNSITFGYKADIELFKLGREGRGRARLTN